MAKQQTLLDQINEEETHAKSVINHKSDSDKNLELGACIMAALDIEREFKLYSYRIIKPEEFVAHVLEIGKALRQFK